MENGNLLFGCKLCNLTYKTHNGLWKHNKKYHTIIIESIKNNFPHNPSNLPQSNIVLPQNPSITVEIKCEHCSKILSRIDNLHRHEKICKKKKEKDETVKKFKILETKIETLENKINKSKPETNKKVINNFNNGTIINGNSINRIGGENIMELNHKEITDIFAKEIESVITFIDLLNFNERLPKNHNFCTTSLDSKYLSTYNDATKKIDKDRKKYFFDKLLNSSVERIEILYTKNKNKFNNIKQKQIEENIINLKSLRNYDFNNKIIKEIMNVIKLKTKFLIFNLNHKKNQRFFL
jgi:hypothetical protein